MRLLADPPLGTVPALRPHTTQPPCSGSSRGETRDSAGCQDAVSGPRGGASPVPRVRSGGRGDPSLSWLSRGAQRNPSALKPPSSATGTHRGGNCGSQDLSTVFREDPARLRAGWQPQARQRLQLGTPRALPQFPSPRKSAETLDVNRGAPRT